MKTKLLLTTFALMASSAVFAAQPKVVAHRGYWEIAGSAQNSLTSLAKADSVGCFASEFDIWMTPDGVIIVNHDPKINGVNIQNTPSQTVLKEKLANGETVPTLDSYYTEAQKHPNLRLVCELKSHDSKAREKECIKKMLELAKTYGLEDRIDYITFSKNGFTEIIKRAPKGTPVYYLSGDYIPEQVKFEKGAGIDYAMKVMKQHPEWIQDCHDRGMLVNVWTVNEPEDILWCINNGVDYITTNFPELVAKMIAENPVPEQPAKVEKKNKKAKNGKK